MPRIKIYRNTSIRRWNFGKLPRHLGNQRYAWIGPLFIHIR